MANGGVVDEFLENYKREFDFYVEAARIAAEYCKGVLRENGIQAIVTYRAKDPERLAAKLRFRDIDKNYKSSLEITQDIVDLAGVRIALYFPSDRLRIESTFEHQLYIEERREFPGLKEKEDYQKFDGYQAKHYRIKLSDSLLSESQLRYIDSRVEIQVASVLMHAWAEVEHDILYKSHCGEASSEEKRILDVLNGLVLTGENLLEELQDSYHSRISQEKGVLATEDDLRNFIVENSLASDVTIITKDLLLGELGVLLRFARLLEIDNVGSMMSYVDNVDFRSDVYTICDQIIERVVAANKNSFHLYKKAYQSGPGGTQNTQGKPALVNVEFTKLWTALEKFGREFQIERNTRADGIIHLGTRAPIQFLTSDNRLPAKYVYKIQFLRNVTTSPIDSHSTVSENILFNALADLTMMIGEMIDGEDLVISTAFKRVFKKYPALRP